MGYGTVPHGDEKVPAEEEGLDEEEGLPESEGPGEEKDLEGRVENQGEQKAPGAEEARRSEKAGEKSGKITRAGEKEEDAHARTQSERAAARSRVTGLGRHRC